jgi:hypothetical protein
MAVNGQYIPGSRLDGMGRFEAEVNNPSRNPRNTLAAHSSSQLL